MSPGGDHHILLAFSAEPIGHRCCVSTRRQYTLPQFLAGLNIERAKKRIKRAGNEDQPSRSYNRAAQIDRSRGDRQLLSTKVLHRAEWHFPPNLPFRHIDGNQSAPRWRRAGHIGRRLKKAPKQSIGCARLRRILAILSSGFVAPEIRTRDKFYFGDKIVRVRHQKPVRGIKRVAAPGHASHVAWNHQRALQTRRGENALIASLAYPFATGFVIVWRRSPSLFFGYTLQRERR